MKAPLFELCAETLEAACAGERGGAGRIELCARLEIGGITPSQAFTAAAVQSLSIPVHVLIRPRGGDFDYSASEFDRMRLEVDRARESGAAGVVLGVLRTNGEIDVERSRELVNLARPLKVTFNRAFDETPDLHNALEAVIATGADCLLTSGGAPDVLAGSGRIAQLRKLAGDRIEIMAGGGLKLDSLAEVLERTGVCSLHGSLTRKTMERAPLTTNGHPGTDKTEALEADVRTAVALLRRHAVEKNGALPW